MSRIKFLKHLFWKPWKIILSGLIWIFGIYDLLLSQFVSDAIRPRFPRLAELNQQLGVEWYWWIIFFLLFSLVIV
jgi:hypothetical protein